MLLKVLILQIFLVFTSLQLTHNYFVKDHVYSQANTHTCTDKDTQISLNSLQSFFFSK